MKDKKKPEDKYLINLADIKHLLRRSKKLIVGCVISLSLLAGVWTMTRPARYTAEGTFREKNSRTSPLGGLAQALFIENFNSASGSDTEAMTLMKSRALMKDVVARLNLQGRVIPKCSQENIVHHFCNNIKSSWSGYTKSPHPTLKDPESFLKIENINYLAEVPIVLNIKLLDENQYRVSQGRTELGIGLLDTPFVASDYAFTLKMKNVNDQPKESSYTLILQPAKDVADSLTEDFNVETTKNDKGVLKLTFTHRDRHFAAELVNGIMDVYQDFIKRRQNKIATIQMNYLERRQAETAEHLKKLMNDHAKFVSSDVSTTGFTDSEKEMEFLAHTQRELKQKLVSNELEIKRIKAIQPSNYAYYDRYSTHEGGGGDSVINDILRKIRELRQERDGLELALQENDHGKDAAGEIVFLDQLNDLKQVQHYKNDLQKIIEQYNAGQKPDLTLAVVNDKRFLIKSWFNKLDEIQASDLLSDLPKNSFTYYLDNLNRLFNVHEKILQERLTHQQKPFEDYQGINLSTANQLYLECCRKLSEEESLIQRTVFFLDQMQDSNFEITSLSSVLHDPVSTEMIVKASQAVLNLKDENNQSTREQTRLKSDLSLQRTFLEMHLRQMVQLMELNKKLIKEKIFILQNITIELINQQISVLEKNFYEFVQSRHENLQQERLITKEHLQQINDEMAAIPQKWEAERTIRQQVEINKSIVEEIAKIVESKTISHNLEVVQSAPIDLSVAPVHPVSPKLPLYLIIGGIFGGLLGSGIAVGRALSNGVQISLENLRILGYTVVGKLTKSYLPNSTNLLKDTDLNTLRRIYAFFDNHTEQAQSKALLCLQGTNVDYSYELAALIHKSGKTVLIIDLDFARNNILDGQGLLNYLEGTSPLNIQRKDGFDHIASGGINRFTYELLTSKKFKEIIRELNQKYQWIIAVSHAEPISAEAETLVPLFQNIAITLNNEKIESLSYYSKIVEDGEKNLCVLLMEE